MAHVRFAPYLLALGWLTHPALTAAQATAGARGAGGSSAGGSIFTLFVVFAVVVVLSVIFVALGGRWRRRRLPVDEAHAHR